jgi:hypothetical protein
MVGNGRADVRDRVSAREIMMTQALVRTGRGLAAVLLLALGACGQPAQAQTFQDFSDKVSLYVRDGQSDHPSIVLYDPVGGEEEQARGYPVVALVLTFSETAQPWDYRAAIDQNFPTLLGDASAHLVTTHTEPQQRRRTYLLTTSTPAKVIAALAMIVPPTGVAVTTHELPASSLAQWAPSRLEFQASGDDQVRRSLAKSGDDGAAPRNVEFFFYKGDQAGLRDAAVATGFTARKLTSDPNGSALSLKTAVDAATFDTLNTRFLDWSDRFKAEYDGWEAEAVKK